jgi:pimeloyl-ACP methyl ester carboxylesterase
VLTNGIRIHYWRSGGNKPPLVLAHGSSDDGLCWTNLAKELEANFDIILPDARGHGLSECEFWAPSKRRHHPDTALISLGTRPPMRDLFTKITSPTLILKADAQGELRKQNEDIARLLKNGKIVHIEGAGHNVRRDQKPRTVAVLKEFFAGL